MSQALSPNTPVAVIGAGTMGAGIAQIAAEAGHPVMLFDMDESAPAKARRRIESGLAGLVARGKRTQESVDAAVARIQPVAALADLESAGLVIEAIVERLDVKRDLFAQLERIVADDALLCTNTSSISITAIAAGLSHPDRVAGLHFFNPAPVMKLVEVISGLATAPGVRACLLQTAQGWGKVAVAARSTPGFIVNRVARPFYGEALRLHEEGLADPATLDAIMTGGGGFRMGPFALMDLIGHDVNLAVTTSVFEAYYNDPRYRPSLIQKELVEAGWLGRKSGRGFFDYTEGTARAVATCETVPNAAAAPDLPPLDGRRFDLEGVRVMRTDGRRAIERARAEGCAVLLYDLVGDPGTAVHVAFSVSPDINPSAVTAFVAGLAAQGRRATRLKDWPALVVMRTVAMLANEAFEAVLHGVADAEGVDDAMRSGVNYPRGPIAWAQDIGLERVLAVLDTLAAATGDPRYRASFALRCAVEEQRT